MGNLISKFNLYEIFRILLPGFYIIYLIYECANDYFKGELGNSEWPIITLLVFVFALVFGTIIYALDVCRWFGGMITNLPTNLMTRNYPELYPADRQRLNEHEYYDWYENNNKNSKTKTELQSGLYHFSINFVFVTFIGIPITFLITCSTDTCIHFILNFLLLILSTLAAILIIRRRLRFQWQRNFWEFEKEIIIPRIEQLKKD